MMRVKLDENVPADLAKALSDLGHDVDTIPGQGLAETPDNVVWNATQASKRFLITQDLDFSDLRRFVPGTHYGILLLRLRDPSRRAIVERVHAVFRSADVEAWRGGFVVMTDRKIRIRRATPGPP